MAIPLFAVASVVGLVLTGVIRGDAEEERSAEASRMFLVQMMGDTDLEPYALEDLTEMASVESSVELSSLALVDRSPDYSDDGVLTLDDWEGTKLTPARRLRGVRCGSP